MHRAERRWSPLACYDFRVNLIGKETERKVTRVGLWDIVSWTFSFHEAVVENLSQAPVTTVGVACGGLPIFLEDWLFN